MFVLSIPMIDTVHSPPFEHAPSSDCRWLRFQSSWRRLLCSAKCRVLPRRLYVLPKWDHVRSRKWQ